MNETLKARLSGIQAALMALYASGTGMSAATRGREREQFVDGFLSKVLPPTYRFGTGDATDLNGKRSGQLDVVVEFSYFPSLPAIGSEPRLYFAEGIAAVIEIKSNITAQWDEVERTSTELRKLKRTFMAPGITPFGKPSETIPFFAVGFTGWKDINTVREKAQSGAVDGLLVIDSGLFSTAEDFPNGLYAAGPAAFWGLISALHQSALSILVSSASPASYLARNA